MTILSPIEHIVVVMFENRSLDHMLGGLYPSGSAPSAVVPPGGAANFDGLSAGLSNPANAAHFTGGASALVPVATSVASSTVPDPDPEETFTNVTYQLYGPQGAVPNPNWPMQGFHLNYAATGAQDPTQIMQCHSATQVPILSALARSYAVSDAWFASVPSQTWPNRAFAHAGTSNGHVDNGSPPDPLLWDVPTIFNVPPGGAAPSDRASQPGDLGFMFDRFGVRVPIVVVSPYIASGTVFRSNTAVPYDHTSILATLRDWLGLTPGVMLPSARIAAAPTLAQLLTLSTPRTDLPALAAPVETRVATPLSAPANDLQRSLVSGAARRYGLDPAAALAQIHSRQHAVDFFKRRSSRALL